MEEQTYSAWIKSAIEQRFFELAKLAGEQSQNESLCSKQEALMNLLKSELTTVQFQKLLEWDEYANYRNALEKQWMYRAGLKDGIRILKELQQFTCG